MYLQPLPVVLRNPLPPAEVVAQQWAVALQPDAEPAGTAHLQDFAMPHPAIASGEEIPIAGNVIKPESRLIPQAEIEKFVKSSAQKLVSEIFNN